MAPDSSELAKSINASGFPLQLGLEEAIRRTFGAVNILREVPWSDPSRGREGYLDLLVDLGPFRFAISAKRTLDEDWVFVDNSHRGKVTRLAVCFLPFRNQKDGQWEQLTFSPPTPQGTFCVPAGKRGRGGGHLVVEPEAKDLISAIEFIDVVERATPPRSTEFVIPVLVTTARLHSVGIPEGTTDVETGTTDFSQHPPGRHPVVRMTKPFSAPKKESQSASIKDTLQRFERTVFVVEAAHILPFLKDFNIDGSSLFALQRPSRA